MKRILILIFLIVFLANCQEKQPCKQEQNKVPDIVMKAWNQASAQNNIKAYKEFMEKYSCNDSLLKIAKEKIDSLQQEQDWKAIKESTNIEDFRAFCRKYPYSYHHSEAYKRVNYLLLNELDSKYADIHKFFREAGESQNPIDIVKKYATSDFCMIKSKKYHEQDWIGDTMPLNKITKQTINPQLLKVCDSLFTPENLLKKYELICDTITFKVKFITPCGTAIFSWIPSENKYKLKCLEIKQDYCY